MSDICDENLYQGDLFSAESGTTKIMEVMDLMNARYGKGSIRLSQDGSGSGDSWKMRQDNKSPEYTTNFNQLPECR